jgi:propanol-preferring alcohol dehydrogenase
MKAMVLKAPGPAEDNPLEMRVVPIPEPGPGEVLIRVEVCGVCRTDLHVIEGDLPPKRAGIIPGHEVVGRIVGSGKGTSRFSAGTRVGVAWLHAACGGCAYCSRGDENLCDAPTFTGYDTPGGYAEYVTAPEAFIYPLPDTLPAESIAPLLCAGIIGYRALRRSGIHFGEPLGLYGFGGSAHLVMQIARYWDCPVYVCTREKPHQERARRLGAAWVGAADETPPIRLRAAILFAPAGELVPVALQALDRGGRLALAGIHMTTIPAMDYDACLFRERELVSVTANTRQDGDALLKLAAEIPLIPETEAFPLEKANEALLALKQDRLAGAAAVLHVHR